jgi:protein-S-isoprenylcysteine O-methyltransferase Ste14
MSDVSAAGPDARPQDARRRTVGRAIQAAAFTAAWLGALFGGAGRFEWPRGWIYAAVYGLGMGAMALAVKRWNPELLEARARWRHNDTKRFDKVFLAIFMPLQLIQPAVAGLDAVRFGWSSLPFELVYPGVAIFALATGLAAWAMAVNRFAETTVRIQADRGHTVVESGPYRSVRHPLYAAAILMYLAAPLILGSVWALAPGGVIAVLFAGRTALEDRTLRRELAGYEEYAARTRHRLMPGLW